MWGRLVSVLVKQVVTEYWVGTHLKLPHLARSFDHLIDGDWPTLTTRCRTDRDQDVFEDVNVLATKHLSTRQLVLECGCLNSDTDVAQRLHRSSLSNKRLVERHVVWEDSVHRITKGSVVILNWVIDVEQFDRLGQSRVTILRIKLGITSCCAVTVDVREWLN